MARYERIPIENKSKNIYYQKQYITLRDKNIYDYFRNYTYLNGVSPKRKDVAAYFGVGQASIAVAYASLVEAGLLLHNTTTLEDPRLPDYSGGMCRVPFKGEIKPTGIKKTKETLVNFYDLVNTVNFSTYRIMIDLKIPYYKLGDYLIISTSDEYADDIVVLCIDNDKPMVCRYRRRTHDCVLTNYVDGLELVVNDLTIVGEIVGSIRCELPIEKMYLRNRIQVIDED